MSEKKKEAVALLERITEDKVDFLAEARDEKYGRFD